MTHESMPEADVQDEANCLQTLEGLLSGIKSALYSHKGLSYRWKYKKTVQYKKMLLVEDKNA